MNPRIRRLQSLGRIADHRRHQAGRKLAEARRERDRIDATLGLLRMHFQEYRRQIRNLQGRASIRQLREFQHFIRRLQQAIRMQEEALQQAETRCDRLLRQFQERHTAYRALERAEEKCRRDEWKAREKQAQKLLDELNTLLPKRKPQP